MYHFIVSQKIRRSFADLNAGRYEAIVAQFAGPHRHLMVGQHALAGERHSPAATARWYARLQRLLPGLQFQLDSIAVSGWPWDTHALVSWKDSFTLPDGSPGNNQGVHAFRIAWGKIRSMEVHCDTQRLRGYLAQMQAMGLEEAQAAPITG
ncbi:MAG: nuclear transport factor 2 family protein [Pseudomonadota bacterium]|uniref:nuclear transport factor 2 family protein n=1 Tax=Polaromonas sp. TaxID=1869339 RepID=UPI001820098C|nr:nuclear transport factor 2 family protein [Polaromonas sp.]MBA3594013.1 nuclear transport factor 2 family protein [Polaromonas sp.]MDQ3273296.1 nuclear transport factor 2 family protein [Pseudomonadota bacterium]